jgi:hypothetical protein
MKPTLLIDGGLVAFFCSSPAAKYTRPLPPVPLNSISVYVSRSVWNVSFDLGITKPAKGAAF